MRSRWVNGGARFLSLLLRRLLAWSLLPLLALLASFALLFLALAVLVLILYGVLSLPLHMSRELCEALLEAQPETQYSDPSIKPHRPQAESSATQDTPSPARP